MATTTNDHAFGFLLRCGIPLVVAPAGPPPVVRLRGIVRPDPDHARVVLAQTSQTGGLAVDFALAMHDGRPTGEAIIDHMRLTVAPVMDELIAAHQTHDSHGNIVVDAAETAFDSGTAVSPGHRLFSLFSTLVHGGGFPWFEDVYTFAGFLLINQHTCRVYLRESDSGVTYGFDLPFADSGNESLGFTALPQEMVPLIRNGDFARHVIADSDDYCDAVVDASAWAGSTPA